MPDEQQGVTPQTDNSLQNVGQQPVIPPSYNQPDAVKSETEEQPVADLQTDDPKWQGKLLQPIHSDLKLPPQQSFGPVRPAISTKGSYPQTISDISAPAEANPPINASQTGTPAANPGATVPEQPAAFSSRKKSKKKLIIVIMVALLLIMLIGGGAFAFYYWF